MNTALITGSNRGIGLALTQHLCARGDHVIATCRHASTALQATAAQIETGIDVVDDVALMALAKRLGEQRIDRLWLNAGILNKERLGEIDASGFSGMHRQFEVNALGPLRVAQALAGHLMDGAKIGIITSRMGSIEDNSSGGYYGYRASKAAVNAIGKSLAIDLAPRRIAVFLLHPGFVATDMGGPNSQVSPAESASQLVALLDHLEFTQSGSFWHANGSPLPW